MKSPNDKRKEGMTTLENIIKKIREQTMIPETVQKNIDKTISKMFENYRKQSIGKSCGPSWNQPSIIPELDFDPSIHPQHLVFQASVPCLIVGEFTALIDQVSVFKIPETHVSKLDKPKYIRVHRKRLYNILDPSPLIFHVRIREKKNLASPIKAGRHIGEISHKVFPDTMKLSLNKNSFPYVDTPSKPWLSTIRLNMFGNNGKAVLRQSARDWIDSHENRLVA